MSPQFNDRDPEKEAYWRIVVEEFEKSGLSRTEFCRRKGIKATTLDYWRKEIPKRNQELVQAKRRGARAKPISSPSLFIPVVAKGARAVSSNDPDSSEGPKAMEIEFAGGKYLLRIDMNIDRESLRRIVTALVDIKC